MTKQTRRNAAQWRKLIDQQAQSGLNGVAFCAQQGLPRKSFYRHRKLLTQKAMGRTASRFVQIQPKPVQTMPIRPGVVLQYRDSRLHMPAETDALWLAQLMKALS